jgi:O-antigen/teichoic acid export membrane protein
MNDFGFAAVPEPLERSHDHSVAVGDARSRRQSRVVENTLLLGGGAALGRLSMVVFRYLALRGLDSHSYGAFALVSSLFVALLPLAHLNLGTALVYLVSTKTSSTVPILRSTALFTLATSMACGIVLALSVPRPALESLPSWVLFLSPIGFFVGSLPTLAEGALRGALRVRDAAVVTAAAGVSRLLLYIVLVVWVSAGTSIYAALLFGPAAASLYGVARVCRSALASTPAVDDRSTILNALRFGLPIAATNLLMGLLYYFPRSALVPTGLKEVGAVDLALLGFSVYQMAVASAASALLPHIARKQTFSLRPTLIVVAVSVGLCEFVAWTTNVDLKLLRLLALTDYERAAIHLRIIALACPAVLHQTLRATELQVKGRGVSVLWLTGIGLLLQITLLRPLRDALGPLGASTACAISLMLLSLLLEGLVRGRLSLSIRS